MSCWFGVALAIAPKPSLNSRAQPAEKRFTNVQRSLCQNWARVPNATRRTDFGFSFSDVSLENLHYSIVALIMANRLAIQSTTRRLLWTHHGRPSVTRRTLSTLSPASLAAFDATNRVGPYQQHHQRGPRALPFWAVAGVAAGSVLLSQQDDTAKCCGIAGVVGTKKHDARCVVAITRLGSSFIQNVRPKYERRRIIHIPNETNTFLCMMIIFAETFCWKGWPF